MSRSSWSPQWHTAIPPRPSPPPPPPPPPPSPSRHPSTFMSHMSFFGKSQLPTTPASSPPSPPGAAMESHAALPTHVALATGTRPTLIQCHALTVGPEPFFTSTILMLSSRSSILNTAAPLPSQAARRVSAHPACPPARTPHSDHSPMTQPDGTARWHSPTPQSHMSLSSLLSGLHFASSAPSWSTVAVQRRTG